MESNESNETFTMKAANLDVVDMPVSYTANEFPSEIAETVLRF